jgi:hypothetical protein
MTRVNLLNSRLKLWDQDNPMKSKLKKYFEAQFLIIRILNDEIEKNSIKKELKKQLESTRVNLSKPWLGYETEITS